MGLTIHYSFRLRNSVSARAQALIEKLHRRARAMPFDRVYPIRIYAHNGPHPLGEQPEWFRRHLELLAFEERRGIVFPASLCLRGPSRSRVRIGVVRAVPLSQDDGTARRPSRANELVRMVVARFLQDPVREQSTPMAASNISAVASCLVALLDAAGEIGLKTKVSDDSQYTAHRGLGNCAGNHRVERTDRGIRGTPEGRPARHV